MPEQIGNRSGLPEMLDAERPHAMPCDRAEPRERCGVSVEHGHKPAIRRYFVQQPFDMRARMDKPAFARALRRRPSRVEAIR